MFLNRSKGLECRRGQVRAEIFSRTDSDTWMNATGLAHAEEGFMHARSQEKETGDTYFYSLFPHLTAVRPLQGTLKTVSYTV